MNPAQPVTKQCNGGTYRNYELPREPGCDRLRSIKLPAILLLVPLTALLVARGVAPALTAIGSDFPGYLTSAKIVADGGQVDRLYDNQWFQEQMRLYRIGEPSEGKFAPFPPPTALLLVPLAALTPINALRAMTALSVLCLAGSIVVLARLLDWGMIETTTFILLSGYAVSNSLRLGQPYIVCSLLCILGFYAYRKDRPIAAGVCFGLFSPIKYLPVGYLAYFAWRRNYKVVLGGAVAICAIGALSIGILGWKIHEEFLTQVLGHHLIGQLGLQDPFTASFQSFDSLFRRLFVFDAAFNPHPVAAAPMLQVAAVAAVKLSLLAAAAAALLKLARGNAGAAVGPSLGIVGILILLIAPATATYHFVLLWLPVALLLDHFLTAHAPRYAYGLLGLYTLIGFCPYGHAHRFEGRGALTVLAYPRLFLLLAMFAMCTHFILGRPNSGAPQAA